MRTYPFVAQKHNTMEAIGEAALLLMYTTCLLLRNDDQDAWNNEWVSRNGYGWLLVTVYMVICPSPMFYSLYLRLTSQAESSESKKEEDFDSFENPLGVAGATTATALPNPEQRIRKAKQQQRKAKSLVVELSQAKKELTQSKTELADLKAKAAGPGGITSGITSGVAFRLDTRRASQVNALQGLVEGNLVDQETVQKAQQRFSKHVLHEIERTDSLREFLDSADVRLGHHMEAFVVVGGAGMVGEDVSLLSGAEMEQVIERAQMTQMEARRLMAVVQGHQPK